MPIASLFRRNANRDRAIDVYRVLVEQARSPAFFAALGVPDTLDGRFELVALHAFLVLRRLKGEAGQAALAQEIFDVMFADMDRSLREMGVGDLSVGKQVKAMAKAFYGRIAAYEPGLEAPEESGRLEEAFRRNLYGTVAEPPAAALAAMARYARAAASTLAAAPTEAIAAARLPFPPAPEAA